VFIQKNSNKILNDMQIAGLKETLKSLKEIEKFSRCEIEPILKTIKSILSCYNCIPNKCLKKRIKYLLGNTYNTNELKINVRSLIGEIEILLSSYTEDTKEEVPI